MDWSDLKYALVVAREGSVTEAARVLGVAHTTVYRRVNGLEERHGVRFFDRTGASWTLTEAGHELLDVGAGVEQQVQAFERRLRGKDRRLEGTVTVATLEPLARQLTRHLHRFRAEHPDIRVVLQVTNELVAVGSDADIALRVTRDPLESLKGRRVGTIGFAVYAATSLMQKGPVDLTTANWVCFDDSLSKSPQGRWEAKQVRDEQIVLRTNNRGVFVEAVSLGEGVGVLPCGLAREIPELVPISDAIPELSLPLWLLTHEDLALMPRVRALLEFVANALDETRIGMEGPFS